MPKKKKSNNSSKTRLILIIISFILAINIFIFIKYSQQNLVTTSTPISTKKSTFDFGNRTINLNNQALEFKNDAFTSSDNSHTATIESRSVNPSDTAAAAILIDNPGGSGTLFYLVAAINKNGQEIFSQPLFLGDRILIESVSVDDPQSYNDGIIEVEYLTRPANSAMYEEPTQKIIAKYAFTKDGNLMETKN